MFLSRTYAYDNRGNITSKKEYAYTTGTLGTATKTVSYAYGNTGWKDLLTSYNGQSITYDTIGNPLSYRGMTLTWANGRQLATLTKSGATSSYSYDINGNRTKKVAGGATTEYYLNEGTIVAEKKGSNIIRYLFDENGGRFGFEYNGARYYYAFNGQGDVVSISNALSNEVARYTYDSWGKLLSVKDYSGNDKSGDASFVGNINPIRYKGYYYDTESGLYYLNSRYYDPETGRFLNADGLLGANGDILSYNQFAYCSNTPIMGYDPTGCCMTLWMQGIQGPCPGLDSPLCADNKIDYTLPNPNKTSWWDTVPTSNFEIPSTNDLISDFADTTLGATEHILGKQNKKVQGYVDDGMVRLSPKSGFEVPSYPNATKILNNTSKVITVFGTTLDIGNTWTANNGNTNGQRVIKTGIQLGGVAAGIGVGYLAVAAANCWNPVGIGMIAMVGTYVVVSVAGSMAIGGIQNSLYNYFDIH